jgi:tetratricopeptide (TPR) repeat protein
VLWIAAVVVVLAVLSGAVVAVDHVRARLVLRRMQTLLLAGRHAEVIAHPEPPRPYVGLAARVRATSAVLTGRYHLALQLLEQPAGAADDPAAVTEADVTVRSTALLGLGRYDEVALVLGDDPLVPLRRRMRAQAAIETGQDWLADRLLAGPDTDPVDEAGRRRILGDLHERRGRVAQAESLVADALRAYAACPLPAFEVDMGYCHAQLASCALDRGDIDAALAAVDEATRLLLVRPDNAPGFCELACVAAQAHAAAGDVVAADEQVARARELAEQMDSPAARARAARAAGTVAWALHRPDAPDLLRDALAQHEALGEEPAASAVRQLLGSSPPSSP